MKKKTNESENLIGSLREVIHCLSQRLIKKNNELIDNEIEIYKLEEEGRELRDKMVNIKIDRFVLFLISCVLLIFLIFK